MVSLRNKRFQLNYCAKFGNSNKNIKKGGVGGEKTFIFSPPLPLYPYFLLSS